MLEKSVLQSLKRGNVSKNTELTKTRVHDIWIAAPRQSKLDILEMCGLSRPAVYRIFKTGTISAKVVIAMAETLNVSIEYLTGESDDRGECTAENVAYFLKRYGYGDMLEKQARASRTVSKKPATKPVTVKEIEVEPVILETNATDIIATQPEPLTLDVQPPAATTANVEKSDTPSDVFLPRYPALPDFTDDEWVTIFKAMLLRAKAGGENQARAESIKAMLLG